MRVAIPEFSTKKELYGYLVANKKSLIDKKKSMPVTSQGVECKTSFISAGDSLKSDFASKGIVLKQSDVNLPEGTIRAKTVANAHGFIDSHFDLLIRDSSKKTIQERKGLFVHLHDHIYKTDAEVGEVVDVSLQDLPISELGYNASGVTQCVVFTTDIKLSLNEKVFNRYKEGRAKQHSIGLQYVRLELAINDPDYEKEKDFFDKYYSQVINKEIADEYGFFWVVLEYKLIENSVVLFGSNAYTPTISIEETKQESSEFASKSAPADATLKKKFSSELDRILELTKSINN